MEKKRKKASSDSPRGIHRSREMGNNEAMTQGLMVRERTGVTGVGCGSEHEKSLGNCKNMLNQLLGILNENRMCIPCL